MAPEQTQAEGFCEQVLIYDADSGKHKGAFYVHAWESGSYALSTQLDGGGHQVLGMSAETVMRLRDELSRALVAGAR